MVLANRIDLQHKAHAVRDFPKKNKLIQQESPYEPDCLTLSFVILPGNTHAGAKVKRLNGK